MTLRPLVLIAGLLMVGCASTGLPPSGSGYAPTDPAKVKIYRTKQSLPDYSEIATIRTPKEGKPGEVLSPEAVDKGMRESAAYVGADAVVDVTENAVYENGVAIKFKAQGK